MSATVKQVAQYAGVSVATVSKYINGGNLKPEYLARVEKAVRELDYQVNEVARNLKTKKSFLVGVLVPSLGIRFYASIISRIQKILLDKGYTTLLLGYRRNNRIDFRHLDVLLRWHVDGIILFPADASSAIPTMKENVANGIPFVIGDYAQEYSNESDKVWSTFVGHDMKALGVKAGEVAVEYLKTLNKDNPVCLYISVPTSGQVSQDRYDGFAETVLAAFPNAKIIDEGDTGAHNRDSAQTLVENVLQRESVIDVVCGHNDAEVVGAYNAAVAQGRNEIKFIGIAGDIDVLNWIQNGNEAWLGEVLQDPVVLGYQATDAMYHALVLGEKLPDKYDLPEPEAITPANIADYAWQSWGWLG